MSNEGAVYKILREFQAKARCRYSQRRAHQLWSILYNELRPDDLVKLQTAWDHCRVEGPAELDQLCREIIAQRCYDD